MDKVFDYAIPLFCGIYYLLLLKDIVKLPAASQQRFDVFVGKKTNLMIGLSYTMIAISIILTVNAIFNS